MSTAMLNNIQYPAQNTLKKHLINDMLVISWWYSSQSFYGWKIDSQRLRWVDHLNQARKCLATSNCTNDVLITVRGDVGEGPETVWPNLFYVCVKTSLCYEKYLQYVIFGKLFIVFSIVATHPTYQWQKALAYLSLSNTLSSQYQKVHFSWNISLYMWTRSDDIRKKPNRLLDISPIFATYNPNCSINYLWVISQ